MSHDRQTIDLITIERRAHKLRAEATRDFFRALGAWVSARLTGPVGTPKAKAA